MEPALAAAYVQRCRAELAKLFIGQTALVDGVLAAALAGGHVLIESVPGLGKTLLVKAFAKILGLESKRIQFTPDLMPADITGSHVFDLAERTFVFHRGPVFAQLVLADEFNRAPAKTHAALLEAMGERQVSLDGRRYVLPEPFLVLATQNPIENEGTYTLPEAALDRFLMKLSLDYPSQDEEERIISLHLAGRSPEYILANEVNPVTDAAGVVAMQAATAAVRVDPEVVSYAARVARRTRAWPGLVLGASPRAGLAMISVARAMALSAGRDYVVPDDVAEIAPACLRHRVVLSPEAEVEGRRVDAVLADLIRSEALPRGFAVQP